MDYLNPATMGNSFKISIIGSGNLAWHLGPALENAGHVIEEIYSREKAKATALCGKLHHATPQDDLDFRKSASVLFFICISDSAIAEAARTIILPEHSCFIAHTSGSSTLELLNHFQHRAVFYPLQTFSRQQAVNFREIPICLECNDVTTQNVFRDLAHSLTEKMYLLDSDQRKVLHLAAVFANNFANHLLGIAAEVLKKGHMDPQILQPLIQETIRKAQAHGAFNVQTGPAVRGDTKVMETHLELLAEVPHYQLIYKIIAESIIATAAAHNNHSVINNQ
jgi:predicted short-subunit dehydrogenase-like oxidoreductase (DUF2520 family)